MDMKIKVKTAAISKTGWMNIIAEDGNEYSLGPDKVSTLGAKLSPGAELDVAVSEKPGTGRNGETVTKRFILGLAGQGGGKAPWKGGSGGGRDYTKETEIELLKQKSMMRLNAANNATALVVAILQVRAPATNIEAMSAWKEFYLNIVTKVRAEDSEIAF